MDESILTYNLRTRISPDKEFSQKYRKSSFILDVPAKHTDKIFQKRFTKTLDLVRFMPILPILGNNIAFSYLDPPPLLNKGVEGEGSRTFKKLSHLGGVPKILLERGDNPKKGGGGLPFFFITLQFNWIYCVWGEKVNLGLLNFDSSVFSVNHARLSSKSLKY